MTDFLTQLFGLRGKVALVTGGREGIGETISLALASAGASVVIATRHSEKSHELIRTCKDSGGDASAVYMDLAEAESISQAIQQVLSQYGHIDILINNAGISLRKDSLKISEEEWDTVLGINLKGSFLATQAVGRHMVERQAGKIVNVSSTFGIVGFPERAAYGASKGGLIQLTKMLAVEWAQYGVTVNAIAPATITTASRAEMFETEQQRKRREALIPLGRLGRPQDVVGAVIFLSSSASDFVTGHTLLVDGGWTAQ